MLRGEWYVFDLLLDVNPTGTQRR